MKLLMSQKLIIICFLHVVNRRAEVSCRSFGDFELEYQMWDSLHLFVVFCV